MSKNSIKRKVFDPKKVKPEGSLGLLALGDVGFEIWREVKKKNKNVNFNEQE